MNKYVWWGNISGDTYPIIVQRKWLCHIYLKKYEDLDGNNRIWGPGWKEAVQEEEVRMSINLSYVKTTAYKIHFLHWKHFA